MINFEVGIDDPSFEEPVMQVQDHLNKLGTFHFVEAADAVFPHKGMEYLLIGERDPSMSREAVILMPAPFGNGVWPHIIARGEAISYMATEQGVRDRNGNKVPVLITAAPCMTSTYNLRDYEYDNIRKGNFSPVASRHLGLMRALGFGQIAGFVGYSYGSVFAAPTISLGESNFDTKSNVLMGEPPHSKGRPSLSLLRRFLMEGAAFNKEVKKEHMNVIDNLFDSKLAAQQFNRGIMKRAKESAALADGMAEGKLARDLKTLIKYDCDTTLLHASNSKISPRKDIIAAYEDARSFTWGDPYNYDRGFLNRLEIVGTNHALGDRVGRFAVLAAKALI